MTAANEKWAREIHGPRCPNYDKSLQPVPCNVCARIAAALDEAEARGRGSDHGEDCHPYSVCEQKWLDKIDAAEARGRQDCYSTADLDTIFARGRAAGLEEAKGLAAECLDVGEKCEHVAVEFKKEHVAYDYGWCHAAKNIYVNVNIPVETIRTWSPERIEAFFGGLAAIQNAANGEPPSETDDGYEYLADVSAVDKAKP